MKYLIWLGLAGLAWFWWRKLKPMAKRAQSRPAAPDTRQRVETMVVCRVCGVHLPEADAVTGPLGVYCSEAHRDQRQS